MMNCTIFTPVAQKEITSTLKNGGGLSFSAIIPKEDINRNMPQLNYRERIFTPDVTLWAFLSQVMDDDQSQQATVARVIALQ